MDLIPTTADWFWTATVIVVVAVIVIGAVIAHRDRRSKMTDREKTQDWLDDPET